MFFDESRFALFYMPNRDQNRDQIFGRNGYSSYPFSGEPVTAGGNGKRPHAGGLSGGGI